MIVHITDKVRIHGTKTCWQIERLKHRKGVPYWESFKYYVKFAEALTSACEQEIRTHPASGLADCIEAATDIAERYGQLLDGAVEEISRRELRLVS